MLIISLPKLGHKLHYLHAKPNIIWLVGKTQRKPKIQSPTTMWLIPKFHYDVANSKSATTMWLIPKSPITMWLIPKSHYDVANSMSHYDVANSKPTMMRHYIQNLLLRDNTLQNLKIVFTKPKYGIYFHKTQIPIWHLFSPIWHLLS